MSNLLKEAREVINAKRKAKIKPGDFKNPRGYLLNCIKHSVPAQSYGTGIEKIFIKECRMIKETEKTSGDARVNPGPDEERLEIKASLANEKGGINFVQLRPHNNIDTYLLYYYDIDLNKQECFILPAHKVNIAILKWGGYAHGSIKKNGPITKMSINDNEYEYALRPNVKNQSDIIDYFRKRNLINKEEYKWIKKLMN